MTREEAQIIIGNIPIDAQDECYSIVEYQEAKTMAIEALSQEPKTEQISDIDTVSRQALLNLKQTFHDNAGYETEYVDVEDIKNMPSVQPKVKIGHWVDGHCSECGCDVPAYIIDWKWQKDMDAKYCPMCGAKMK